MNETDIELIKKMDKNDKLIREEYAKLRKSYGGRYIAIDGGKVIASSSSLADLNRRVMKGNMLTVLIRYIPGAGVEILY